jgi:MFS family permease
VAILFQGGIVEHLSRKFGEARLAIFGILLSFIGLMFLPFADSLAALVVLMSVMGAGTGLSSPTLMSLISLSAEDDQQGTVLGASRSVSTMARIFGPLWAGWAYGAIGMQWTYWMAALLLVLALYLARPLVKLRLRPA